ncbi:MAG TPA: hypothetical protein VFB85_08290 [Vicinamibacterales bacterium]|jgi:hypothetical protein|nr:hypothetical protein [Vicinamibacterales bacterium]
MMESGFRSPLLDFFRRGDVARDVRLVAAQGALAPRAHEQLGLLVLLISDPDPEIAATAEATLQAIPREALEGFLARSDAPTELVEFFGARGIHPGPTPSPSADEPMIDTEPESKPEEEEEDSTSVLQRLAAMNVPQRLKRATKGTREERAVLIRDPNKMIAVAVLSSPKLTTTEVEAIARMANVSDEILRIIAMNRAWMKNYNVVWALAKNPKTPVPLSLNLLPRLAEKELRTLSSDRNVPDILRITARKKIVLDK